MADISKCKAQGTLVSGQSMDSSHSLISTNDANRVVIHSNGDMRVYGTRNGQYSNTWCSRSIMDPSKGPFSRLLEKDGNLCTKSGANYWCPRKTLDINGPYRTIIRNDGNLVIYTADDIPPPPGAPAQCSVAFHSRTAARVVVASAKVATRAEGIEKVAKVPAMSARPIVRTPALLGVQCMLQRAFSASY